MWAYAGRKNGNSYGMQTGDFVEFHLGTLRDDMQYTRIVVECEYFCISHIIEHSEEGSMVAGGRRGRE